MPGKTFLTTVGEQDARAAKRRLWHLLLEGDKGCLIWWSEDCIDWKSDDYALTPRAKALAPVLSEMQSPLARLFLRAEREYDPIAIHYSQASIQVDWLLESTEDGSTWLRRFSSYEAEHNKMAKRRQAWVKLLQDAGYSPRFISSEQIEGGELENARVLVLPDSLAFSEREIEAIAKFNLAPNAHGLVVGMAVSGVFDQRGRLRMIPATGYDEMLSLNNSIWSRQRKSPTSFDASRNADPLPETVKDRMTPFQSGREAIVSPIRKLVVSAVDVPAHHCIRTHRYKLGVNARLFAFERNIVWQMSEDLKQRGGNEALEKPVTFEAKLAAPEHVYDLRSGKYLGYLESIPVNLDPWQPSLYALTERKLPDGDVIAELEKLALH